MQYGFGTYVIISVESQKVLTVPEEDGMAIQQQTRGRSLGKAGLDDIPQQSWNFLSDDPYGVYKITSVQTGKVLSVQGASQADQALIVVDEDNGEHYQRWTLQLVDADLSYKEFDDLDTTGFAYVIMSRHSGRVLDVRNASTDDGAVIQQYQWHYGPVKNQQWIIEPAVSGPGE